MANLQMRTNKLHGRLDFTIRELRNLCRHSLLDQLQHNIATKHKRDTACHLDNERDDHEPEELRQSKMGNKAVVKRKNTKLIHACQKEYNILSINVYKKQGN
jgi:hypothetical protein